MDYYSRSTKWIQYMLSNKILDFYVFLFGGNIVIFAELIKSRKKDKNFFQCENTLFPGAFFFLYGDTMLICLTG